MSDRYDEAAEALERLAKKFGWNNAAMYAWGSTSEDMPKDHQLAHRLFAFCTPDGEQQNRDGKYCGCLTQIRIGAGEGWTDELTTEIRADERIPKNSGDITREHIPVFQEWQRKLDVVLGRAT